MGFGILVTILGGQGALVFKKQPIFPAARQEMQAVTQLPPGILSMDQVTIVVFGNKFLVYQLF